LFGRSRRKKKLNTFFSAYRKRCSSLGPKSKVYNTDSESGHKRRFVLSNRLSLGGIGGKGDGRETLIDVLSEQALKRMEGSLGVKRRKDLAFLRLFLSNVKSIVAWQKENRDSLQIVHLEFAFSSGTLIKGIMGKITNGHGLGEN